MSPTDAAIILILVAAGYFALAWWRKLWPFKVSQKPKTTSRQDAIIETLVHETPAVDGQFPNVFSQAPLSAEVKQGIIDAFAERIGRARDLFGWTIGLNPAIYTIYVFPSVRDHSPDGTYSPVFQVFIDAGSWYDGSIYDQEPNSPGGWIFAAEQVLTRGSELTNAFVIAMNDSREYTQRAVSYGLDHLFAWHNDRIVYERTKDHSEGGGHPLW
jgi:hypothetical protein